MKELIFFWRPGCPHSTSMIKTIDEISLEFPEIKVTKINVNDKDPIVEHYYKAHSLNSVPATLGMVDGKLIDGHVGVASKLMTLSLLG